MDALNVEHDGLMKGLASADVALRLMKLDGLEHAAEPRGVVGPGPGGGSAAPHVFLPSDPLLDDGEPMSLGLVVLPRRRPRGSGCDLDRSASGRPPRRPGDECGRVSDLPSAASPM